jgi:hypothetical protein
MQVVVPGNDGPQPAVTPPLPLVVLDAAPGSHVQPPAIVLPPMIGGQTPPLLRVDHEVRG